VGELRPHNLLELIGNTPLVKIRRLNPNPRVTILAKLEGYNPGGSIKARPALAMVEAAEKSGELVPGKIVIEPTSGNTGIGVAMICAIKGYRCLLAMSENVSRERRKILAAYGAQFMLTPAELGTDGSIEKVYEMERADAEKRYVLLDQYNNRANPLAHYASTAPEIWEQTAGRLTHFFSAIGTTGTVVGCGRFFKEQNPDAQIVAVEPCIGHHIQGLKSLKESYVPGIWDKKTIDRRVTVNDEQAYSTTRRLAREEGLMCGMSSGAAMWAALETAKDLDEGVLVVILPDGGERYLSTDLFTVTEA